MVSGENADFRYFIDDIRRIFPVARSDRRTNADLFEQFVDGPQGVRNDDEFYPALASMMSGEGIQALRDFDSRMLEKDNFRKTFHFRGMRHLRDNLTSDDELTDAQHILAYEFPSLSLEANIQDFLVQLFPEDQEIDDTSNCSDELCNEEQEPECWRDLSRCIAEQATSLTEPNSEIAHGILELAERLLEECETAEKAERERANLSLRQQDLFERLAALNVGLGERLAEGLDGKRLDEIEVRLAEFEAAKVEGENAHSKLQSLNIEAREAFDRGDLDAETRLIDLRRSAHSRNMELSNRAGSARHALEQSLQTDADESAKDVDENATAPEEIERDTPQPGETSLETFPETEVVADSLALAQNEETSDTHDPVETESLSDNAGLTGAGNSERADIAPELVSADMNDDGTRHTEEKSSSEKVAREHGVTKTKPGGHDVVSSVRSPEKRGSDIGPMVDTGEISTVLVHFLQRGEVTFAWHLARLQEARGETLAIPAEVFWGLNMLRSVRTAEDMADEQRGSAMAVMMDVLPRAADRAAASRLALAALLRPALFDPFYGARSQLQNLLHENSQVAAAPLIEVLANLGHDIVLSEETLSDLAGTKPPDRLKETGETLSGWLEIARRRKTSHRPTYSMFHRELHAEGRIGKVVEAAIANSPGAEALVGGLLEELGDNHPAHESFIAEAERRIGRPRKDRIEGIALEWLCRNLQEVYNLLQDWRMAHGEQAAAPKDRQRDALRRATGTIRRALKAIADQDEDRAPAAGGLAAAADTVLNQGFDDLRDLLDGAGKLDLPRRIRDVTETPLLRLPGGCQDWTDGDDPAFHDERAHRDSRLLIALLRNDCIAADDREAFGHRIEERSILASKALLDLMDGAGFVTDLESAEYRQVLEETCTAARHDSRDQIERLRQAFATISYLDLETGDEVRNILAQLSTISEALSADIDTADITLPALSGARMATVPPDFPELDNVLSAFDDRRERLTVAIAERQKEALQDLCKSAVGGSAKTILAEMNRLDPVTVDDAIAELSAGREVPLPEADAADEFERFFPDFVLGLDVVKEELARGRVIKASNEGGSTGPLDFSRLDETGRRRARQLLEIWGSVENAMKQTRSDRFRETIEALLDGLGFTDVRLSDVREVTPGTLRRFIIRCDQVRPDGWFLPPAFGSVAEGHYRGAVVRGDIRPEQILRVIGAEAPDQPWIIVILRRMNVIERRVLAQKARSEARQVLVLDESLLLHLCVRGEDPLAGLFACALPFGWVQPYVTRAGAIPPEMFFGRKEEMSQILARDGGGCLIYGGRQLGKSALLNHIRIERHRPNSGELVIYLDIKPVGGVGMGPECIWDEIRHELKTYRDLSSGSQDANDVVRIIEKWLTGDPSRRLLVMFDEADNFLRAEHAGGYPNLLKIKGLMESTGMRFKAVFAGLHNVRRMAQAPNSPLPHLGEPICIGPMNQTRENRTALRTLATKPMRSAGLEYADPALASDMIARMNYYPSLVQVFCRQVVETIGRRTFAGQDGPRWRLSREALFEGEAAEKAAEQIRERFQLTLNLDVRYECIAKSLALHRLETSGGDAAVLLKGLTPSEVLEFTRHFWPDSLGQPRILDIEELLKEMVDLGVLSGFGHNRYGLRNALVAQMLGSRDRLETDLLALNERDLEPAYDAAEFHSLLRPILPNKRSPLSDRDLESLFDNSNPGMRLVVGQSALVGPDLARRIQASADIWRGLDNPLIGPNETELRRAIDGIGVDPAVLVIEGAWKAKVAENLARHPSIIDGHVLPVWCLDQEPEFLPDNISVFHTRPWSEAMVRHWLADESLAQILDEPENRRAIMRASGGAPARLEGLLPTLKDLAGPMNDIGERLHGWTEKNLITVDALGLDGEDHEFLWEVSELGEAFASREEMKLEIQLASDKRISRLTAIGLLHDGGSRDHVPTVTPLGLLLV